MSDRGSVGLVVEFKSPIRQARASMATGVSLGMGMSSVDAPDFEIVETPVPSAGLNAIAFLGPGRFTWQTPVNAGLVTVTVQMRKESGYGSADLPYLELAAEDQRVSTVMADTTGSYVPVVAALTIRDDGGVMCVSVVRPWLGSNFGNVFLSSSADRRRLNAGVMYVSQFVLE